MKSAKNFIFGFLAFALLCGACTVFGAVAYAAGQSSESTATPSIAPTISWPTTVPQPTALPTALPAAANEPDFCTLEVRMYSDVIDSSVFLVISGDMHDIACELMEQSIKENMPSQEGMHAEISRFAGDPEYPVYCSNAMDTGTFIQIKAENATVGDVFCKGFLKKSQ